jgi:hypothetical protein
MNKPDHISESLEIVFGLKYFNSLMRIWYGKNSDPGWKKFGSGIIIPDPQHCPAECLNVPESYVQGQGAFRALRTGLNCNKQMRV